MLEVTQKASDAFRTFLERTDVQGSAIKLVPEASSDGETGIGVQPIEQPGPNDVATSSPGVVVVVAGQRGRAAPHVQVPQAKQHLGRQLLCDDSPRVAHELRVVRCRGAAQRLPPRTGEHALELCFAIGRKVFRQPERDEPGARKCEA